MFTWSVFTCVLVLLMAENDKIKAESLDNLRLSKSLGYAIHNNLGKNLEDFDLGEKYMVLYNEMLKSNPGGQLDDVSDMVNPETDLTNLRARGIRRLSGRMASDVRRRRVRSQALRLEKLNSQSLRSHRQHSRQSSLEKLTP